MGPLRLLSRPGGEELALKNSKSRRRAVLTLELFGVAKRCLWTSECIDSAAATLRTLTGVEGGRLRSLLKTVRIECVLSGPSSTAASASRGSARPLWTLTSRRSTASRCLGSLEEPCSQSSRCLAAIDFTVAGQGPRTVWIIAAQKRSSPWRVTTCAASQSRCAFEVESSAGQCPAQSCGYEALVPPLLNSCGQHGGTSPLAALAPAYRCKGACDRRPPPSAETSSGGFLGTGPLLGAKISHANQRLS